MRILALSMATMAAALIAQPATAAARITKLSIFNYNATNNCAATDNALCSPLGVTAAGTTSPLLNAPNRGDLNLTAGSYYLYGNPWPGTSFMDLGAPMYFAFETQDGISIPFQIADYLGTVPDLSVAGTLLYKNYGISLSTTGLTTADLVSFGGTDAALVPDGYRDFVLRLDFGASAPIPEPASWAMMIAGFSLAGGAMRRRKLAVRFA